MSLKIVKLPGMTLLKEFHDLKSVYLNLQANPESGHLVAQSSPSECAKVILDAIA